MAAVPLPQAAHSPQDEKEWETEDEGEIVGGHEETEPEEQDAVNVLVNLAQVVNGERSFSRGYNQASNS